jgi:hypothetical protein
MVSLTHSPARTPPAYLCHRIATVPFACLEFWGFGSCPAVLAVLLTSSERADLNRHNIYTMAHIDTRRRRRLTSGARAPASAHGYGNLAPPVRGAPRQAAP